MRYYFEGQVRRVDLRFRSAYPYIPTKIFQLDEHEFVIAIIGEWPDFEKLKKEFNYRIKSATTPVNLVCAVPEHYKQELKAISDSDIINNYSGFSFTNSQLDALIPSLLPRFDYQGVEADHSNQTTKYYFKGPIKEEDIEYIHNTLIKLELPYKPTNCTQKNDQSSEHRTIKKTVSGRATSHEVMSMRHYTKYDNLNLPYLKRDDEFWFDNIEKIYSGEFKKDNLFFWDKNSASCYLDLSVFKNINIRNHILLYDKIYMTLPLGAVDSLLQQHNISRHELLWLIENNRLVILNVQPDSRLDSNFLREAYERNPKGVISRRSVAALCAIDLIELNENYIFNEIIKETKIEDGLREISSSDYGNALLNFIYWPKSALRKSFERLLLGGPMSISTYGVNQILEKACQDNKKLQFEYSVASRNAHLAHALGATYFPFVTDKGYSDAPFSTILGNTLNVYKTCNFDNFESYIRVISNQLNSNISQNIFETLNINDFIDIQEFVSCSDIIRDKSIGLSLVKKLSELPLSEREEEILKYNNAVLDFSKRKTRFESTISTALDIASILPPVEIVIKVISILRKSYPKLEELYSNIIDNAVSIKELECDRNNVKYLYQINSIAKLKTDLSKT